MRLVAIFVLLILLVESRKARKQKLLRTLPNYKKYNHGTEILQGDEYPRSINPVFTWQEFVSQNEDSDTGSDFQKDFSEGISTKSTGSENFNTVEVIPGPRGLQGPPGILLLEEFAETLELLKEVEGDIKKSRKGRYKAGGPVLNIVFSAGLRGGELDSTMNNSGGSTNGGFFGVLKTDIFLQRLSRNQISNFLKSRSSATSFNFNSGVDFDRRSGILTAQETAVYMISATINLQRMPDDVTEMPDFEDNITGRICMDDDCSDWALETRTPVLHTKYACLKMDGIIRIEAGNKIFLFVENNSGLNFKVLRSTSFSAYAIGPGG